MQTSKYPELAEFDGTLLDGLEFCSRVYRLFESIRNRADGVSQLRRRKSRVVKKLLEELLPICRYVQASYRLGRYISVRWTDGNQQCDAELVQRGGYVSLSYLEVTCVMHRNEHLVRELLDTKGAAFGIEGISRVKGKGIESVPVGFTNREHVDSYTKLLKDRIENKAGRSYPAKTTLVVECTLNTAYTPDEWEDLIGRVSVDLPTSAFSEIYLYDTVGNYSALLLPPLS